MDSDNGLATQLEVLSRGDTLSFVAPTAGVAQRLDTVRRALRRQGLPDPALDYLLFCAGGTEQWLPLTGETVIGTAPDAGIRLASRFVSARHCRLSGAADAWVVEDLGSRNGVFVNGQRVTRLSLCAGDAIQLADVTLILVGRAEPQEV